jgi:regulator of nucleoside diphosphate kinase
MTTGGSFVTKGLYRVGTAIPASTDWNASKAAPEHRPAARRARVTTEDYGRLQSLIKLRRKKLEEAPLLQRLDRKLATALVFRPEFIPGDVVTTYSCVRFSNVTTGDVFTYALVFPGEASGSTDKLSILSPIGIALLGNSPGDAIVCETPGGMVELEIRELVFQPESIGQY